jgi:hypothetical protein
MYVRIISLTLLKEQFCGYCSEYLEAENGEIYTMSSFILAFFVLTGSYY